LLAGVAALVACATACETAGAGAAEWSPPALLSTCAGNGAPAVVFPSDSPTHATGPGAVLWPAVPGCSGGAATQVAAVGPDDVPARPRPLALTGATAARGPYGRVVMAGAALSGRSVAVVQGTAGATLAASSQPGGPPLALASAYLGDVALASAQPSGRGGLRFRVERWFARSFGPWREIVPSGAISEPVLALDYRSDLLAVWRQRGAILARDEPASGRVEPLQRLAGAAGAVHVAALRSDDNRAIVAWSVQRAGVTSVYLDQSAPGVRFVRPQLLERYRNPYGMAAPAASPQLVRLRSESVMLAWQGASAGSWVVRAAPVDQLGLRQVTTLTPPSGNALLAALAPAPDGGALALWTEPLGAAGGTPDLHDAAIAGAGGIDTFPGLATFGPPEAIAPPGPNESPQLAVDPRTDAALAVWRTDGGELEYAIRNPAG
jgi:hypothetical protein